MATPRKKPAAKAVVKEVPAPVEEAVVEETSVEEVVAEEAPVVEEAPVETPVAEEAPEVDPNTVSETAEAAAARIEYVRNTQIFQT